MTGGPQLFPRIWMYEGVLSTLNNKTKEFIVGLVITSFNEHLSHFSDLEKNIVGQRVIPSPAKNMPPKNNPKKNAANHPKIDPAPRDRNPIGKVHYPQNKEGGLNKYARSEKNKRLEEAVDNLDIALKARFEIESKSTTDIMEVKIEATKLFWILINEDSEQELATLIAAILDSKKDTGSTIQTLCKNAIDDKNEVFKDKSKAIDNFFETMLTSFVDNHKDLGELLVDKTGDYLSDDIRNLLTDTQGIIDEAILSILNQIAICSPDEIMDAPSSSNANSLEDNSKVIDYFDRVIMELTIKNLELPKKTPIDKKDIEVAIYRRCQIMAIKNMARTTSNINKTVSNHGKFIVEQAHTNQDKMLNSAKRVLILKDLEKLNVDMKNKIKSKQIESARSETEKFLLSKGIKKEEIVRIYSFSERLASIRIEFRNEYDRDGADLKIRSDFNNHKVRSMRHQHDNFPGNVQPNLAYIKEVLRDKYNSAVTDVENKIDKETWGHFIQLSIINAGYRSGKKNYIEFTDPTCPNYNVLVYNHEVDDGKGNPFVGFEWNEVIPNPNLRQRFINDPEKLAFYAFKTYGLHTRKSFTQATWKKVETDWMNSGAEPPQVTTRRTGAARRNG